MSAAALRGVLRLHRTWLVLRELIAIVVFHGSAGKRHVRVDPVGDLLQLGRMPDGIEALGAAGSVVVQTGIQLSSCVNLMTSGHA
jgi:hypothetical protein